jgi:hypothetical protein
MGVEASFVLVYHPQSNGEVERANALIFTAIKNILEDQKKGKWVEEPIWSRNTSVSRATNFMPFKLLYEEEPVTPKEIKFRSARTRLEAVYSTTEAESKYLMEHERMKANENLSTYQDEMRDGGIKK